MIRQPHGTEATLPPLPQFPLDHFLVGFDDDFQGLLAFLALYFFVHLAAFPDAISPALRVNLNRPFGRLCRLVAQSRAIEGCRVFKNEHHPFILTSTSYGRKLVTA